MRGSSAKIPRSKSLEKAGGARAEERASRGASRLLSPRGCGPRLQPALRGPPGTPRGSPLLPLCSFQGLLARLPHCHISVGAIKWPPRPGRSLSALLGDGSWLRTTGIPVSVAPGVRSAERLPGHAAARSPRHHVRKAPRVGKVQTRRVDGGTQGCPPQERTDQFWIGFPAHRAA